MELRTRQILIGVGVVILVLLMLSVYYELWKDCEISGIVSLISIWVMAAIVSGGIFMALSRGKGGLMLS